MHVVFYLVFNQYFSFAKHNSKSGRQSLESEIYILSQKERNFIIIPPTGISMRSSIYVANKLDVSETASLFSPSYLCQQTSGNKTENTLWWQMQQLPHRPAGTQSHPESGTGTRWGCGLLAAGAWLLCGAWQTQSRRLLGPGAL